MGRIAKIAGIAKIAEIGKTIPWLSDHPITGVLDKRAVFACWGGITRDHRITRSFEA